jgi:TolA-binding protein
LYEGGNEEVLVEYPQSTYAKYILYTNGLSNLYPSNQAPKEKKYLNISIANFERLIKEYPPFEFTDVAMYYLAVAYHHIGKKEKANELLNQVITKYPDSDGAEMAKQFVKDPSFGNTRGDI